MYLPGSFFIRSFNDWKVITKKTINKHPYKPKRFLDPNKILVFPYLIDINFFYLTIS